MTNDNQLYHIANHWEWERNTYNSKKILKGSNIEKMHNATYKLRKMSKVTSHKLN